LARQSELLDISRASLYYQPKVNQRDIGLMNTIDQIYTDLPFYGSRRIQWQLKEKYHIEICRQYVQRLMRLMGIEAIYPKKNTSKTNDLHVKYPYLLNSVTATAVNHVWGTDITYGHHIQKPH
jgi:putative transposase